MAQNTTKRKTVCIQGVGFVGAAMMLAVANAKDKKGNPLYNVVGIELDNEQGRKKVQILNHGIFPYETVDESLQQILECALDKNLYVTTDNTVFADADIVVVDINLDILYDERKNPYIDFFMFKNAMHTLGKTVRSGTLIIVETTVPPGTCEKIVYPIIKEEFQKRGFGEENILIAHSYERVMPGKEYYNSIVNFWRVYSGIDEKSANACENFLSDIINTKDYPLFRLKNTTASETAKVLENSYRAVNIAFMEEWGRFAEMAGVDIFEVIEAIRMRPTHSNIRQPGFGVGGYCLTKDPYFALLSSRYLYGALDLEFPFSTHAVVINDHMPLVSLEKLKKYYNNSLDKKRILLLGISYRKDIGDTRHSPSEIFVREAAKERIYIDGFDPLVKIWKECDDIENFRLLEKMPRSDKYDIVIFAVSHKEFCELNLADWLGENRVTILDANHVLSFKQEKDIEKNGSCLISIGKG